MSLLTPDQLITLKHDSYRIVAKVGAGGYGSVWKVKRESDRKTFALKTINPLQSHNQHAAWRSLGEIKNLTDYAHKEIAFLARLGEAAVEHFIIPMLDYGEWEHKELPGKPLPVFIMPYYAEGDLSRYCKGYPKAKPYTAALFLQWAEEIAQALAYLHDQDNEGQPAIHRDIKPANVLLDPERGAGLTDFGIARRSSDTGTMTTAYSRHFCAPEQLLAVYKSTEGHNRYLLTPGLDIYSFGILLHELLTGSTQAQELLATSSVIENHNQHLSLTDSGQFEPVGRLGEIGGLNSSEEEHLYSITERLFSSVDNGGTIIAGGMSEHTLPLANHLARRYVSLQEAMLAPWPKDRPTAKQIVHAIQQLKSALNPTVTHLSVAATDERLSFEQAIRVTVTVQGEGLTRPAEWLHVEVNHRTQTALSLEDNSNKAWLYDKDSPQQIIVTLEAADQIGDYLIDVFVRTAEQQHKASVSLQLPDEYSAGLHSHSNADTRLIDGTTDGSDEVNTQTTDSSDSNNNAHDDDDFEIITPTKRTKAKSKSRLRPGAFSTERSAPKPTPPVKPTEVQTTPVATPVVNKTPTPVSPDETEKSGMSNWLAYLILLCSASGTFAAVYWGYADVLFSSSESLTIIESGQSQSQTNLDHKDKAENRQNRDNNELSQALIPGVIAIEGGSFLEGCVKSRDEVADVRCKDNDVKGHQVNVAGFTLAEYEVTTAQYRAFVDDTKRPTPTACWGVTDDGRWQKIAGRHWLNPGFEQNEEHPVVCVNAQDAQDYTAWLSQKTGETWRLPTGSEWEYAARAGSDTAYYWGDTQDELCSHANGVDTSTKAVYPRWHSADCNDGYPFTAPVGSYEGNAWGLYDVLGNVWELTADCYDSGDCTARSARLRRGGSWSSNRQFLRLALRHKLDADARVVDVGFRVVRD